MPIVRTLLLLLLLLSGITAYTQNTTRRGLKAEQKQAPVQALDTIVPAKGDIAIFGYEKAQTSTTESMFVTNNTDLHIRGINLTITYINGRGEELHRRTENIKVNLEPGETNNISIKSWDKQHLWYYGKTQAHRNKYGTPYNLKVKINYLLAD